MVLRGTTAEAGLQLSTRYANLIDFVSSGHFCPLSTAYQVLGQERAKGIKPVTDVRRPGEFSTY